MPDYGGSLGSRSALSRQHGSTLCTAADSVFKLPSFKQRRALLYPIIVVWRVCGVTGGASGKRLSPPAMENEPQLRLGSPAKQAALAAGIADSPPGSDDWSLKAHGGSVSRIPKPAPLTPSDQGIKGKVGHLGVCGWRLGPAPILRHSGLNPGAGSRRPTARCLPHARAALAPPAAPPLPCRPFSTRQCPPPASRACGRRL